MAPKIVNHYGHTVNSDNPITGVIGINDINHQALYEAMDYEGGINLNYEEALKDYLSDNPDNSQDDFNDNWEDTPDDEWLIGSWTKDKDGYYIPDEMGEYAAIVRESTIQVVWSKHTIRVLHLCSPCYPGQADIQTDNDNQPIESDNGYLTYNLPIEFYTDW